MRPRPRARCSVSSSRAAADERRASPTVELLGGYGIELVKVGSNGPSAYGVGLGMRAGDRAARASLRRRDVHPAFRMEAGRERRRRVVDVPRRVSRDVRRGRARLGPRPRRAARAGVRGNRRAPRLRSNRRSGTSSAGTTRAFFYVAPGLLTAARIGRWFGGFDVRLVMVARSSPRHEWAPALLFVLGTAL